MDSHGIGDGGHWEILNQNTWMEMLSAHYQRMRSLYPDDQLIILFDIDGTVLDTRHMVVNLLQSYDEAHGTDHFSDLRVEEVATDENRVRELLTLWGLHLSEVEKIAASYNRTCWTPEAVLSAHRPYAGVMEVMRWFQIQPNTHVGLNTGRSEEVRAATLDCLNTLGKEYKVRFTSDLLRMNPYGWRRQVDKVKADVVQGFRQEGYRVFAMVDNEPANLASIALVDPDQEIMLLHADTLFASQRRMLPPHSIAGNVYDITLLAQETALPRHVQFVWHGINDERNLRQFLASNVVWGEVDVRIDPTTEELVLRHNPLGIPPVYYEDDLLSLSNGLRAVWDSGRSIKLDIKEKGPVVSESLAALKSIGFDDSRIWFNADANLLKKNGFAALQEAYPSAIIQCPIDSIASTVLDSPNEAMLRLKELRDWGINRFSVKWDKPSMGYLIEQLTARGYELNIYNVPNMKAFLETVLLLPRSITADFNFPQWNYFGRGSGQDGQCHEYLVKEPV